MKRSNKIISAAVVSTVIVSSGIIGMANNNGVDRTSASKDTDMKLNIKSGADGRSFNLKVDDISTTNAFHMIFKIDGNVEYKSISFAEKIKSNGTTDIKTSKDGNVTTVDITVTSETDLTKAGELEIGTVTISGNAGEEYRVTDAEITTVTATYDEDGDSNLEKTGDLSITVGEGGNGDTSDGGEGSTGDGSDNSGEGSSPEEPGDSGNNGSGQEPDEKPESPGDSGSSGGNSSGGSSSGGNSSGGEIVPDKEPTVNVVKMTGSDRYDTATKISQMGWKTGADTVVIVNGNEKHMVDGLSATPLASVNDAPVLLSNNGKLPSDTVQELKRLKPKKVYIIGGTTSVPATVVNSIKNTVSNVNVTRIGGSTRYETSLAIAKEIDKTNDVSKIFVSGGNGEVDALSIASVAGKAKAPIILTDVNKVDSNVYNFIKSENVGDAYFIGGEKRISDKTINQINQVVSKDVSKNRIAGNTRKDTNAKVIEKFYTGSELKGTIITKDDVIVDALTVGSFAAKNDMPVVIGKESLSTAQKKALSGKKTENIYQAGGGTKQSVMDTLKDILKGN